MNGINLAVTLVHTMKARNTEQTTKALPVNTTEPKKRPQIKWKPVQILIQHHYNPKANPIAIRAVVKNAHTRLLLDQS